MPAALAGRISVPPLQWPQSVAVSIGAIAMRQLWTSDLGNRRDDLSGHTQTVGSVVPHDVVGDKSEKRGECPGSAEGPRIGKLQNSLDVVAQAEASHGSPWP